MHELILAWPALCTGLFLFSEILALFPKVRANSVFQFTAQALKGAYDNLKVKPLQIKEDPSFPLNPLGGK